MLTNQNLKIHFQWQSFSYILLLFFWLFRFEEGVWFSDLSGSPFIKVNGDFFYWLLHLCNIPQSIISNIFLDYILDSFLVFGFFFLVIYPQNKFLSYLTSIIYTLYVVVYNSSTLHHTHSLLACLFMSWVLCFKSIKNYHWAMEFFRLYSCFIMASAGLWKIGRGSIFQLDQMSNILAIQQVDYIIDNPNTFKTSILTFLINNPNYSYILWVGAIIIELIFLIGFFSKKFDWILLLALSIFIIADYFLMDLYFWEFFILGITFFNRQNAPYPLSKKIISYDI